jgi:hypothetical protein
MRYLFLLVALASFVFATSVGVAQEAVETPIAEGPPGYCEAMPPGDPMPTRPTPAEGHGICPTPGIGVETPVGTATPTPSGTEPTATPSGTEPTPTPGFTTPTPTPAVEPTPVPQPTPRPV